MIREESELLYPEVAEEIAKISNILSHEVRVMILLSLGKHNLSEIVKQFHISFQTLNRHIEFLLDDEIIKKGGSKGVYELTEKGNYVFNVLKNYMEIPRIKKIIEDKKRQSYAGDISKKLANFLEEGFAIELLDKKEIEAVKRAKEIIEKKVK